MKSVFTSTRWSHSRTALAVNSLPLSDRMWPGGPRSTNSSASRYSTSSDRKCRATSIARHSPGVLVDDRQHAGRLTVVCASHDEVVGPDVVRPSRPETDAGPVVEPQPSPLRLLHGNLQPLAPPDAFHPLVVDDPALGSQQRRDATIAVAAILGGQADDRCCQRCLVVRDDTGTTLRRTRLSQVSASSPLRDAELLTDMHHTTPATLGAYQFPSTASFRTSFRPPYSRRHR